MLKRWGVAEGDVVKVKKVSRTLLPVDDRR